MTDKEVMQMALEALEGVGEQTFFQDGWNGVNKLNAAITALREALARPQLSKAATEFGLSELYEFQEATGCDTAAEYRALAQPQGEWVDLTDDEIKSALTNWFSEPMYWAVQDTKNAIAKFKEKNTPVVPQGEPVAWIHTFMGVDQINTTPPEIYGKDWTHQPLYTTPPVVPQGEWVDLTAGEIEELFCKRPGENRTIVQEAIAKFKSKNTPPVVPQEVTEGNASEVRSTDTGEPVYWAFFYSDGVIGDEFFAEEKDGLQWMKSEDCLWDGYIAPVYTAPPSVEAAIDDKQETIAYFEGYKNGRNEMKEKAAKVCDDIGFEDNGYGCAAAIRKMK